MCKTCRLLVSYSYINRNISKKVENLQTADSQRSLWVSGMHPVQHLVPIVQISSWKGRKPHLEVLGLDDPGEDEGADGEEGGEQEGEDHLDVRPRPEAEHAEQHQLSNLRRDIFI